MNDEDTVMTTAQVETLKPEDRPKWPVDDVLVEQTSLPRHPSSLLCEHYEMAQKLIMGTEAEADELKQRVEALEEEKRQSIEDRRFNAERIAKLEAYLDTSRKNWRVLSNEREAENTVFRARNESLEQQLSALKREKTPVFHKVGASSKIAAASANLHKQLIEDLKQENQDLVEKIKEKEAKAKLKADQLQSIISALERERESLESRLDFVRQNSVPRKIGPFGTVSVQGFNDDGAEATRLQEIIKKQQAVIEQQERDLEEYAQAEAKAWEDYDGSDELILENPTPPREELDELVFRSATVDEPEEDHAGSLVSHTDEPKIEQPELEAEEEANGSEQDDADSSATQRNEPEIEQQCRELETRNRGLQEQDTKWRKLFTKFVQRAADLQRKDVSKHQIKKGFKDMLKIVKEGGLQGL